MMDEEKNRERRKSILCHIKYLTESTIPIPSTWCQISFHFGLKNWQCVHWLITLVKFVSAYIYICAFCYHQKLWFQSDFDDKY